MTVSYFDEWLGEEVEEEVSHYTVQWWGQYFHGDDANAMNTYSTNDLEDALRIYNSLPDAYIQDNIYGVTFHEGEWA